MANELALKLETPVEELAPQMIAFNESELLEKVGGILSQYDGVTYDEAQIDIAKKDRAQLNAFCKALNDERIRVGKVYCAPYDGFKQKVDKVIDKVKVTILKIDEQIKAFELEKQHKKQDDIIEYFSEVVGEFSGFIPYERIHQSKWLNTSTSMKSVKTDIDNIIANAKNAMIAIDALGSEDVDLLKAYYFRTLDLSAALLENERLKTERAALAELKAKQESQPEVAPVRIAKKPEVVQKTQTVRFAVTATIEQLKALQNFLIENNIEYSPIK
jgi:hypothetical protein